MRFLQKTVILACVLAVYAEKDETKSRDKRQHLSFHSRRNGRPPPYAVQMEPIAHYSQRDPLYNPLAESKIDDQSEYYEESPYNYYPTEPEPIIEIIIKESNESLPTPVPPTAPPISKSKKEPIQVFYVKYEKKQEYGDEKPRVVYDTPVPALTPVEEHEEINPENSEGEKYLTDNVQAVTPSLPEPSTTLRAVIRPDSETYHSGSSGIRVTFGTEQVPPNNHSKRSDKGSPSETNLSKPTDFSSLGSSKRPHGPFAPIQPISPHILSTFSQQRIVNPFAQQQLLGPPNSPPPSIPPNFSLQPQFHQSVPPHIRNQYQQIHSNQRPQQQRPSITIQGLPEVQQRLPFNSFVSPHHLNANHQQQPGPPQLIPVAHQNTQLQNFQQQLPPNQPPSNFHFDPQLRYKQQREQEKQRYVEQQRVLDQRQHEQKKQQEQQRHLEQQRQLELQRQLEQQRQQKQQQEQQKQQEYRILEQRRKLEQQKLHIQQQQDQQLNVQQQQQQQQEQQYNFGQIQQSQQSYANLPQKQLGGEILKAIPKLEQHYAIRENPLHPGPFPPNPQYTETPQTSLVKSTNNNRVAGSLQQYNLVQQSHQQQQLPFEQNKKHNDDILKQQQEQQPQSQYQNQQTFFSQNFRRPQQQIIQESLTQSPILERPTFQSKILNDNDKIFAIPTTKTVDDSKKYTVPTSSSIHYSSTPKTRIVSTTQSITTPLTTTTLSPKKEAKIKENIANLPDEVPDDIREQLLSSGILGNADIQILDYDKVGGINIGDLPPEALANFYGAGGAAATAASEPIPQISKRPKIVDQQQDATEVQITASSSSIGKNMVLRSENQVRTEEITLRPGGVEMKVVRFDPNTAQGQTIADKHISSNATRLSPVAVGEREPDDSSGQYNRYLPLKVSGTSFPIPSVPELTGKKITSVVVLAPVDYNFQPETEQLTRQNRKVANDVQAIRFLTGDSLKLLVKKPSAENYKRWLDQERQTEPQRQSVVLLVTTPIDKSETEKEIFMYDVSSESVSKLAGDLSTAFVDAAESNSDINENPMIDVLPRAP